MIMTLEGPWAGFPVEEHEINSPEAPWEALVIVMVGRGTQFSCRGLAVEKNRPITPVNSSESHLERFSLRPWTHP